MNLVELSTKSDSATLRDCAVLYCEVFLQPPWCEDFWTTEGVMDDLLDQMVRPGFSGFLAIVDSHVVGFTCGYTITKLEARNISGHKGLDYLFAAGSRVFYVDELGVKPSMEGRGMGKKLTYRLVESARKAGHNSIVLRTDRKAEKARAVYAHVGFQDLGIQDKRHQERTYWLLRL